jgi:hypothetical protein
MLSGDRLKIFGANAIPTSREDNALRRHYRRDKLRGLMGMSTVFPAWGRAGPARPKRSCGGGVALRPPAWNASEALACDGSDRASGVRSTLCAGGSKAENSRRARRNPDWSGSAFLRVFVASCASFAVESAQHGQVLREVEVGEVAAEFVGLAVSGLGRLDLIFEVAEVVCFAAVSDSRLA